VQKHERKIAGILAADVVSYSTHMQRDEPRALEHLNERRAAFERVVGIHGGRTFGSVGDSLMAEFPSAVNAALCARAIQAEIDLLNTPLARVERMELRIGLHLGDVIEQDGGLFGDGVNLAARLQALAPPGGIVVSAAVFDQVKGKIGGALVSVGRHRVKGFNETVRVYQLVEAGPRRAMGGALLYARSELARGAFIALAVAALVGAFWFWQRPAARAAPPPNKLPVVAVAPVQNLTGDPKQDWLGTGLANLVRDRLAQSRFLVTVSRGRWDTIVLGAADPGEIHRRARAANIDYVLFGELIAGPDGLVLTNRISNVRDGSDVLSQAFEGLDAGEVIGSAARLTILAKQALKVPQTEQVDSYAADFAVRHLGAYEAYIAGLRYHLNFDFVNAEKSMRTALELAPDFHMARYRLAMIRNATGWTHDAARIVGDIPKNAPLGRRERLFIDAATAFFVQDFPRTIAGYRALLAEFPNEVEGRQRLAEAYFHARQFDDAIRELRFLGQVEPENEEVWNQLTAYLTIVGRLDEAEAANRAHAKLAPGRPHPHTLRADIERERGNLEAASQSYDAALAIDCRFPPALQGRADIEAIRGDVASAIAMYRQIVPNQDLEVEARLTTALNLAALLAARGELGESSKVLADLEPLFAAERIRLAQSLAVRAQNALAADDLRGAAALAAEAVKSSPAGGVPTRYLHTRGQVEVARGDLAGARATAAEIRKFSLPPENPDRTEEKAALHLEALAELAEGRVAGAIEALARCQSLAGYRYRLYEIDLARALSKRGADGDALALLSKLATRDVGDPRIDLEPERARAQHLRIELATGADRMAFSQEASRRWGRDRKPNVPAYGACPKQT
jgi:adenylate cyclase